MSVCVVGGTGFIGRHLCQALHSHRIEAFSTSRAPDQAFLQRWAPSVAGIELDDPILWQMITKVETVIYLGSITKPAYNWRAPDHEIEFGVAETARFIRRVLDVNPSCHIIYASSGGTVYGANYNRPITEDDLARPATSYALGKYLVEQTLRFYTTVDNAKVTILRIANPVGKWQMSGRHGLVSALVKSWASKENITIYGDGTNIRDYFDADDLAEAFISILSKTDSIFRIYNVSSGIGRSERDVIEIVQRTLGCKINCQFQPPRNFDLRYAVLNPALFNEAFFWTAETSLEDTILKMAFVNNYT